MDENNDIGILLMLTRKYGTKKGVLIWAHQKDLQLLEDARKKSAKWPEHLRVWLNCIDVLEENEKRSRERLK